MKAVYSITKIVANKPELKAELRQEHINEILDLVRSVCNLGEQETMSIDRLEILDDIIQVLHYQLRGEQYEQFRYEQVRLGDGTKKSNVR